MEIYSKIVKALERKERAVLATLTTRVGSAPRAVGAKYLIMEDGQTFGSVGGGCVEAEVWQEAQKVMEKGEKKILHFELTPELLAQNGMICGGNMDIFLEPLKEEFLMIYQEAAKIQKKGGSAILATLISGEDDFSKVQGEKVLIRTSGEKIGNFIGGSELEERIRDEGIALLKEKRPKVVVLSDGDKRLEVLLEPILSEPTLYLFGGGHISEQVAPLAKRVHFKVVVIDDRETFANRDRFPEADEVVVSEFMNCLDRFPINESSYLVIVTRGHLSDGLVLEQALKTNACYIGMIGSKRKIHTLYENLMKKGIPPEALKRVHAPIGIDIHSETPEEIAVSIVAELIKVRGEPSQ